MFIETNLWRKKKDIYLIYDIFDLIFKIIIILINILTRWDIIVIMIMISPIMCIF